MMKKYLRKMMSIAVLMTPYTCAAEGNFYEYKTDLFTYQSVDVADQADFEVLRETHNKQNATLQLVPEVANVFDNQIARRTAGNAWHALIVRNTETNEVVASLVFGRIAVVYTAPEHANIATFMQHLGVVDSENNQINNSGVATYVLMTDMVKNADHLAEFHQLACVHARAVAESPLPQKGERATRIVLLVRPDAPDAAAMEKAGFKPYSDSEGNIINLKEFYPPKDTIPYVLNIK